MKNGAERIGPYVQGTGNAGTASLPTVSVYILSFNGSQNVAKCLPSIQSTEYSHLRIVVIDNASSDDTVSSVRQKFPDVEIVRNSHNYGFAGGNNVGLRDAIEKDVDYVILLNDDTIVLDKNWVSEDTEFDGSMTEYRLSPGASYPLPALGSLSASVRNDLRSSPGFLRWHILLLLGYALCGRGFAYLGYAPIYIGEIGVALSLVTFLQQRQAFRVFETSAGSWLLVFMAVCALQTFRYIGVYGLDCLRDAVLWSYGLIALGIAGVLVSRPEFVPWLIQKYRVFVNIFVLLAGMLFLAQLFYRDLLPVWPGTVVPIVDLKPGDLLVHFGGCFAAVILGISRLGIPKLAILAVSSILISVSNRGGMVALAVAILISSVTSPDRSKAVRVYMVLSIIVAVTLLGLVPQIDFGTRATSPEQLVTNVASLFSNTGTNVEGTKEWRLRWWGEIVDYTFHGDYFWTGKGFGIDLAKEDGHALVESQLRSPHNSHLTILARGGVPAFVSWLVLQGVWVWSVLGNFFRSRNRGDSDATRVFGLLLAYWGAFVVNACFDVVLEGPMGGIWFWSIFGVGLGTCWCYERWPDSLRFS